MLWTTRWCRWPRIKLEKLLADVSEPEIMQARKDADKHPDEVYPGLRYTESRFAWVLLYNHVRRGQIDPWILKRMKTADLEYLAASMTPHPDLLDPEGDDLQARRGQAMKILENVARATRILERRTVFWRTIWAGAFGGIIGASVGAVITAQITGH